MLQFSPNSTIALVGSSDGLPRGSDAVPRLCAFLESLGLRTVVFPSLYQTAAGTPQPAEQRARRHPGGVCVAGGGCSL